MSLIIFDHILEYRSVILQCFGLKFVEIGKVMLTWGILKNVNQVC